MDGGSLEDGGVRKWVCECEYVYVTVCECDRGHMHAYVCDCVCRAGLCGRGKFNRKESRREWVGDLKTVCRRREEGRQTGAQGGE